MKKNKMFGDAPIQDSINALAKKEAPKKIKPPKIPKIKKPKALPKLPKR